MKHSAHALYQKHWRQAFVFLGIAASRFIVFIQQIIIARFIEKNEFGVASVSFSLISILLPLLSISFSELSYRYAYGSHNRGEAYCRYGELLSRSILASFLLFVTAAIGLCLIGFYFKYLIYNLAYIFINFWFVQVLAGYRVVEQDVSYAFGLVLYSIFSISVLLVCLKAGLGYEALPISAILAFILSLYFGVIRRAFLHAYRSWFLERGISFVGLIRDVLIIGLTNLVSQAYLYVDVFIANFYFEPEEVADLRVPSLLLVVASVFPVMFFSYFAPKIAASNGLRQAHGYYRSYLKAVVPLCVIGFSVMFFSSESLILLVFGSEYASAELLMKWYAVIIVVNILVRAPIGNILALRGYYKFNMMISIFLLMVMIALQYVMAGMFGIIGIPMATLVVAVAAAVMSIYYYSRRLDAVL